MQQIIHLTDFHIVGEHADDEVLRQGNVNDYLLGLRQLWEADLRPDADRLLVATGDFVDRGGTAMFTHAEHVIAAAQAEFGITPGNTVVCIGNHDIIRANEMKGEIEAARAPFYAFASKYGNAHVVEHSVGRGAGRAYLIKLECEGHALIVDATLGAKVINEPARLSVPDIDQMAGWVRTRAREGLLVVAVHYPMHAYFAKAIPFDTDDPDAYRKHIFADAVFIQERIHTLRPAAPTVWLMGDVHRAGHFCEGAQTMVMTGRIGTKETVAPELPHQASLVTVGGPEAVVRIAECPASGYAKVALGAHWRFGENVLYRRGVAPEPAEPVIGDEAADVSDDSPMDRGTLGAASPGPAGDEVAEDVPAPGLVAEVLLPALQTQIVETVIDNSLYHFGRFETSNDDVSLSWVPIGPLLNQGAILSTTLSAMSTWIESRVIEERDPDGILLIGADCWGAAIAAQLGVLLGVRNYSLPARGKGVHHSPAELVAPYLARAVEAAERIVLCTDVVATGRSLGNLYAMLTTPTAVPPRPDIQQWFAVSVLCDPAQQKAEFCQFLSRHATACTTLKMLRVPLDFLPSRDVLPPVLSFR